MSRRFFRGRVSLVDSSVVILAFLALCFLIGALAGHALAGYRWVYQDAELTSYLQSFVVLLQNGEVAQPSFGYALFSYCKYPALVFLLGYASVGAFLIPAVTFYQGFTMSFAVSAFIYTVDEHGFLLALLLFGVRCLVVLPCYFLLAGYALTSSARLASAAAGEQKGARIFTKYTLVRFLFCLAILAVGALLEHLFLAELLYAVL